MQASSREKQMRRSPWSKISKVKVNKCASKIVWNPSRRKLWRSVVGDTVVKIGEEILALYLFTVFQIATNQPCNGRNWQPTYLSTTERTSRDQPVVTSTFTSTGNNVFIPEAGWNILAIQAYVDWGARIVVCKTHLSCGNMNGDRSGGTSVDVPIPTLRSNNLLSCRCWTPLWTMSAPWVDDPIM